MLTNGVLFLKKKWLRALLGVKVFHKILVLIQSDPNRYVVVLAARLGRIQDPVFGWLLLDIISRFQEYLPSSLYYGNGIVPSITKISELKNALEVVFDVKKAVSLYFKTTDMPFSGNK